MKKKIFSLKNSTKIFLLILLFSFLSERALYAAYSSSNCQYLRMDEAGGTMEHIPVMDQGDTKFCFSYAATQMVDAYRFSHGDGRLYHKTSPIAAAIKMFLYKKDKSNLQGGGDQCKIANYVRRYGSCGRYAIKDYFKADEQGKYLESFIAIHKNYQSFKKIYSLDTAIAAALTPGISAKKVIKARRMITRDAINQVSCQLPQRGEFTQYEMTSKQILKALDEDNPLYLLEDILDTGCSKGGTIPYNGGWFSWGGKGLFSKKYLPYCKNALLRGQKPSRYLKEIHQKLNGSFPQQPVSISYCSQSLKKGKGFRGLRYYDQESNAQSSVKESKGRCGKHVSLIIGRKWNAKTNKCQLLVRNSWGTSCNSYADDWDCEKGNIWVDEEDLGANIYEVKYLGN